MATDPMMDRETEVMDSGQPLRGFRNDAQKKPAAARQGGVFSRAEEGGPRQTTLSFSALVLPRRWSVTSS
jgi:hypothetical protein